MGGGAGNPNTSFASLLQQDPFQITSGCSRRRESRPQGGEAVSGALPKRVPQPCLRRQAAPQARRRVKCPVICWTTSPSIPKRRARVRRLRPGIPPGRHCACHVARIFRAQRAPSITANAPAARHADPVGRSSVRRGQGALSGSTASHTPVSGRAQRAHCGGPILTGPRERAGGWGNLILVLPGSSWSCR